MAAEFGKPAMIRVSFATHVALDRIRYALERGINEAADRAEEETPELRISRKVTMGQAAAAAKFYIDEKLDRAD